MWLHVTEQLSLENLPLHHTSAGTIHKICSHLFGSSAFSTWTSLGMWDFHFWARKIRWTLDFSIPISREHCLNYLFGDHAKTCMTAWALSLSVELLFLLRRPFNTSSTVPSTSNLSRILVIAPLLVVVYKIQSSYVFEFQQHSPVSNNTPVTTCVHRLIISSPCFLCTWRKMNMLLRFCSDFCFIQNKNFIPIRFVAEK